MPDTKFDSSQPSISDSSDVSQKSEEDLAKIYFAATGFKKCRRGTEIEGVVLKRSYLCHVNGDITVIPEKGTPLVGQGAFGRIKKSRDGALKIQTIKNQDELEKAIHEAEINVKLGIGKGPLIIRTYEEMNPKNDLEKEKLTEPVIEKNDDEVSLFEIFSPLQEKKREGFPCKVYQEMHYLGVSLTTTFNEERKHASGQSIEPTAIQHSEIDRAIAACILVKKLHSGEAAVDGTPYAHCDIKPDNITIDKNGRLHLIDFGSATEHLHDDLLQHLDYKGTPKNGPIDIKHFSSRLPGSDQDIPVEDIRKNKLQLSNLSQQDRAVMDTDFGQHLARAYDAPQEYNDMEKLYELFNRDVMDDTYGQSQPR